MHHVTGNLRFAYFSPGAPPVEHRIVLDAFENSDRPALFGGKTALTVPDPSIFMLMPANWMFVPTNRQGWIVDEPT